jgi:hypothetical protein
LTGDNARCGTGNAVGDIEESDEGAHRATAACIATALISRRPGLSNLLPPCLFHLADTIGMTHPALWESIRA